METTPAARPLSLPVLAAGLVTTALALSLSWWLWDAFAFNAMGFYLWYVLPVGALIVGLLAGSGYGIAAWMRGVRIGGATLAGVVLLQLAAYGVAQVIEYQNLLSYGLPLPDFWTFLDEETRALAFQNDDGTSTGSLGALGYGLRLLDIGGFVFGALAIPLAMRSKPYCGDCGQYMRASAVGTLPASVKSRIMLMKSAEDKAAYKAEQAEALTRGQQVHNHLFDLAAAGDGAGFAETASLARASAKDANKLPTRLAVTLASCPSCRRGILSSQTVTGQGKQVRSEALASANISPEVVRALDA